MQRFANLSASNRPGNGPTAARAPYTAPTPRLSQHRRLGVTMHSLARYYRANCRFVCYIAKSTSGPVLAVREPKSTADQGAQ